MPKKDPANSSFATLLLKWNKDNNTRKMPWKGEKDPYKIWLSEIILQQTRVDQGLAYYNRFIETFPTIIDLANAGDAKVFKLWEGLGYYSRCRNLLHTARFITSQLKGKFPAEYDEIRSLKGVGPYTAAAISSFAYNQPYAVVDGNVFRVLSRVFGIKTPVDSTEGKKIFTALAGKELDKTYPALYNQAIMDFGATICKPALPECSVCIFQKNCIAFQQNLIATLPVKEKKLKIRKRWFYFLLLEHKKQYLVRQRNGRDIWDQLFEFPLFETNGELPAEQIINQALGQGLIRKGEYEIGAVSPLYKQTLSHQLIHGKFIHIRVKKKNIPADGEWLTSEKLREYAFPKLINQFLKDRDQ